MLNTIDEHPTSKEAKVIHHGYEIAKKQGLRDVTVCIDEWRNPPIR